MCVDGGGGVGGGGGGGGGVGLKGLEAKAEKTRLIPLPIQPCFLL